MSRITESLVKSLKDKTQWTLNLVLVQFQKHQLKNDNNHINNFRENGFSFPAEIVLTEWLEDQPIISNFKTSFINSYHQDADVYARECSVGSSFCKVISYYG
jgi:hypothetical protein